jgi:hypothetical protein
MLYGSSLFASRGFSATSAAAAGLSWVAEAASLSKKMLFFAEKTLTVQNPFEKVCQIELLIDRFDEVDKISEIF